MLTQEPTPKYLLVLGAVDCETSRDCLQSATCCRINSGVEIGKIDVASAEDLPFAYQRAEEMAQGWMRGDEPVCTRYAGFRQGKPPVTVHRGPLAMTVAR